MSTHATWLDIPWRPDAAQKEFPWPGGPPEMSIRLEVALTSLPKPITWRRIASIHFNTLMGEGRGLNRRTARELLELLWSVGVEPVWVTAFEGDPVMKKKPVPSPAATSAQSAMKVVHASDCDRCLPGTSKPGEPVPIWLQDVETVFQSRPERVLNDDIIARWWTDHTGRDWWGESQIAQHDIDGDGTESTYRLRGDRWIDCLSEGPDGWTFGILRIKGMPAVPDRKHSAPAPAQTVLAPVVEQAPPVIIQTTMYDTDSRQTVVVTEALHARAVQVMAQLLAATIQECEACRIIKTERLYLALGRSSFGEWADQDWHLGRTRAYQYAAVAERLPRDFVEALGTGRNITKLIALAQLPAGELRTLTEQKILTLADGRTVDVDELRDMAGTQVDLEVQALRRKLKESEHKAEQAELALEGMRNSHGEEVGQLSDDYTALVEQKSRLEAELQELRSQQGLPDPGASKTIARLQDELQRAKKRLDDTIIERDRAQEEKRQTLQAEQSASRGSASITDAAGRVVTELTAIDRTIADDSPLSVLIAASSSCETIYLRAGAIQARAREILEQRGLARG